MTNHENRKTQETRANMKTCKHENVVSTETDTTCTQKRNSEIGKQKQQQQIKHHTQQQHHHHHHQQQHQQHQQQTTVKHVNEHTTI